MGFNSAFKGLRKAAISHNYDNCALCVSLTASGLR